MVVVQMPYRHIENGVWVFLWMVDAVPGSAYCAPPITLDSDRVWCKDRIGNFNSEKVGVGVVRALGACLLFYIRGDVEE